MWLVEKEKHTGTRWVRAWCAALALPIVAVVGFLVGTAGGGSASGKLAVKHVAVVSPEWTQTETQTQTRTLTAPAKTVVHTVTAPTRTVVRTVTGPTETVVHTVTAQTATSGGGHASGDPSSPVAQVNDPGSPTTAQVEAAEGGGTAIAQECLDEMIGVGCSLPTAAVAPVSPAVAPSVPCGPASAHTLAASPGARVYSETGSVYGCAPGRPGIRLGSATICIGAGRAGPAAAAGALAAYALERCGVDTVSTSVIVRRFSDGKELYDEGAWTLNVGPELYAWVGSTVVDRAGDVAWIATENSMVSDQHWTEVAERVGGGVRVLDAGSQIVAGSLRLNGATLTWRDGSATRSARLG
jgi:hypothetical protein